jgi:hypothetical protein
MHQQAATANAVAIVRAALRSVTRTELRLSTIEPIGTSARDPGIGLREVPTAPKAGGQDDDDAEQRNERESLFEHRGPPSNGLTLERRGSSLDTHYPNAAWPTRRQTKRALARAVSTYVTLAARAVSSANFSVTERV